MTRSRFTEEQSSGSSSRPIKELCRNGGFSDATLYKWSAKFGGMAVPAARRLRELDGRSQRLEAVGHPQHGNVQVHAPICQCSQQILDTLAFTELPDASPRTCLSSRASMPTAAIMAKFRGDSPSFVRMSSLSKQHDLEPAVGFFYDTSS